MATHISIESLSPITHNQIPVVTTELLANLYGTDTANIKKNYSRNKDRFVDGIATDLGYKPHAFTHIPASKEKFKQIH